MILLFLTVFTLSNQLTDFNFLVSIVIWYYILFQINVISKSMQNQTLKSILQ